MPPIDHATKRCGFHTGAPCSTPPFSPSISAIFTVSFERDSFDLSRSPCTLPGNACTVERRLGNKYRFYLPETLSAGTCTHGPSLSAASDTPDLAERVQLLPPSLRLPPPSLSLTTTSHVAQRVPTIVKMSKKGAKAQPKDQSYEIRDVVLAKVRGFPPWPGIVSLSVYKLCVAASRVVVAR